MHYVLVDFENVPHLELPLAQDVAMTLVLLVGEKQKKLKTELVEQLLARAEHVQFVRLTVSGRNALDLTLAYHLGRIMAAQPSGHFHIISKDKEFDALVTYLRAQGKQIMRCESFLDLLFLPPALVQPKVAAPLGIPSNRGKIVGAVENLKKQPKVRPKNRSKLHAYLKSHLGDGVTDETVDRELDALANREGITIDDKSAVAYPSAWPK
jgi:hypothetical protein